MGAQGTATVDFGTTPNDLATVTVTGQSGIDVTNLCDAWVFPSTTADHNPDEHVVEELQILAGNIIAGTGFTIYARCPSGATGQFTVAWVWN